MKLEWSKIVNNAISMLVAAIVLGAGALIWTAGTSVGQKVDDATTTLREQSAYLREAVDVLQAEMVDLVRQNNEIVKVVNDLHDINALHDVPGFPALEPEAPKLESRAAPENDYIQQKIRSNLPKMGF